jgi:hypothetical protein
VHTGNAFLNRILIAQELKAKIGKGDCIKLISLFTAKETITRMNRQPTEREKVISSYLLDKKLNLEYIKHPKIKTKNQPVQLIN